jgi:translation initiation factor IF-2
VLSPGDDGDVIQTNSAVSTSTAANLNAVTTLASNLAATLPVTPLGLPAPPVPAPPLPQQGQSSAPPAGSAPAPAPAATATSAPAAAPAATGASAAAAQPQAPLEAGLEGASAPAAAAAPTAAPTVPAPGGSGEASGAAHSRPAASAHSAGGVMTVFAKADTSLISAAAGGAAPAVRTATAGAQFLGAPAGERAAKPHLSRVSRGAHVKGHGRRGRGGDDAFAPYAVPRSTSPTAPAPTVFPAGPLAPTPAATSIRSAEAPAAGAATPQGTGGRHPTRPDPLPGQSPPNDGSGFAPGGGGHGGAPLGLTAGLTGLLLFLVPGFAHWLRARAELRPHGLSAGRRERPG